MKCQFCGAEGARAYYKKIRLCSLCFSRIKWNNLLRLNIQKLINNERRKIKK